MKFTVGNDTYQLEFERIWETLDVPVKMTNQEKKDRLFARLFGKEQPPKTTQKSRCRTCVKLMRLLSDPYSELKGELISYATCRRYFKDPDTREEGRRVALRRLTPFIKKELRQPMWQTYLNRVKEEPTLEQQMDQIVRAAIAEPDEKKRVVMLLQFIIDKGREKELEIVPPLDVMLGLK